MVYEVNKLFSWDTEYSADSSEFCPIENYHNYLAVGTYQLADKQNEEASSSLSQEETDIPKERLGRLYLKHLRTDEKKLVLVQQIETEAILDMKWCQHRLRGDPVLAVANAAGLLKLYKLRPSNQEFLQLVFWCQHEIEDENTLALSLDWSSGKDASDDPFITVSDSKGKINILQLKGDELTLVQRFHAHDFEAWITAFDYWNPNIVYTGGDDCKFRKYDVRCDPATALLTSRVHNAGVTSIHCSPFSEYLLASGSYDENVNIWDTRKMSSPQTTVSTDGGVWRLKWEPHGKNLLLAACMYNGFHVIENGEDASIVASFMEHKSIAYGSDWWYGKTNNSHIVASASFYDHLLCLWEFAPG
ncbi:diphthine methyltransferase [Macrobrachium rosenbergii]|uniref:diphthine methyltransferase n=1 Tax=Macrobrachium rosenbergii TaxID=79674 RepID=UPI0034D732B5